MMSTHTDDDTDSISSSLSIACSSRQKSSNSSCGSNSLKWVFLCGFESITDAEKFAKFVLTPNATSNSKKPNCSFYDPNKQAMHRYMFNI